MPINPAASNEAPNKGVKRWLFKVDTTEDRVKCTKRCVQIARKSAKFLLNPKEIVPFTAKIVIQNEKIAAVNRAPFF